MNARSTSRALASIALAGAASTASTDATRPGCADSTHVSRWGSHATAPAPAETKPVPHGVHGPLPLARLYVLRAHPTQSMPEKPARHVQLTCEALPAGDNALRHHVQDKRSAEEYVSAMHVWHTAEVVAVVRRECFPGAHATHAVSEADL